jgi:hypothetical protein
MIATLYGSGRMRLKESNSGSTAGSPSMIAKVEHWPSFDFDEGLNQRIEQRQNKGRSESMQDGLRTQPAQKRNEQESRELLDTESKAATCAPRLNSYTCFSSSSTSNMSNSIPRPRHHFGAMKSTPWLTSPTSMCLMPPQRQWNTPSRHPPTSSAPTKRTPN